MSRRRYISTRLSLDREVNRLAMEYGDFAALLYTWMIPHAEDNCCITGDPEELMLQVVPGRRDKTVEDVQAAINGMVSLGLLRRVKAEDGGHLLQFPPESFYRYQTYIPEAKRAAALSAPQRRKQRGTAKNSEERRESAKNTASPSPSPSPSPTCTCTVPPPPLTPPPPTEAAEAAAEDDRTPLPEDPAAPVVRFCLENFIPTATPYQVDKLAAWVEQDGMEPALVVWAMEEALRHNVRTIAYVESILTNCRNEGIRTRVAAEARKQAHAKGRDSPEEQVERIVSDPEELARLHAELEEALAHGGG